MPNQNATDAAPNTGAASVVSFNPFDPFDLQGKLDKAAGDAAGSVAVTVSYWLPIILWFTLGVMLTVGGLYMLAYSTETVRKASGSIVNGGKKIAEVAALA